MIQLNNQNISHGVPGIFDRPGFGSVSFRDSIPSASLFSYETSSNGTIRNIVVNGEKDEYDDSYDMNESIDDSNSSNISSENSTRSNSETGNGSAQGSSIGSAGSLLMRNRNSNSRKHTNLVIYFSILHIRNPKNVLITL